MRRSRIGAVAHSLAAASAVLAAILATGCAAPAPAATCEPVGDTATLTLADDRGVLSARVWVPVVRAAGRARSGPEAVNAASASLSDADLDAILAATGEERRLAVLLAVGDLPLAERGVHLTARSRAGDPAAEPGAGRKYSLLVPSSEVGTAIGEFYAAALERQGHQVTVSAMGARDAIDSVLHGQAGEVALLELPDLARVLGALLPSTAAPGQVEAAATVAGGRSLVVGRPTAADRTPQVHVTRAFAAAHGVHDLSGLARACPGLAVAATAGAADALAPLTAAYGLGMGDPDPDAVERVRAGEVAAVLARARRDA